MNMSLQHSTYVPMAPNIRRQSEAELVIASLGNFSVRIKNEIMYTDGRAKKKPLEMLKILIACGGAEVSQEKISQWIWPDADGDIAQKTFDTTLYRLRRMIGVASVFILREGRLSLNPLHGQVDCQLFEQFHDQWEYADLNRLSGMELDRITQKLFRLYRGHFLQHENDEVWLIGYRQRLQSKYIRMVQRLAQAWLSRGDQARALDINLKGLETDWYVEQFYQQAMICYKNMGLRGEALMLYQRCQHQLNKNFNIAPSAKTKAIRQELLNS